MSDAAPLSVFEADQALKLLAGHNLLLAVSGGPDSMALLHLVWSWSQRAPSGRSIWVATVDHGLRSNSGEEAQWVGNEVRKLGLSHVTLVWPGPKPSAHLQAEARLARYRLLADHARSRNPQPVAIVTAHHLDDQAETLLMRLARGSGLDGLSAMQPASRVHQGVTLLRPLLEFSKSRLIASLLATGGTWLEDPSNSLDRFERVRIRKSRPQLEALGLTAAALARSARRLSRAREVIDALTAQWLNEHVVLTDGLYGHCRLDAWRAAGDEVGIRALRVLIDMFGGASPRPRLTEIETLHTDLVRRDEPTKRTLGGVVFRITDVELEVWREAGRSGLPRLPLSFGAEIVWDGRYTIGLTREGAGLEGLDVGPLDAPGYALVRDVLGKEISSYPRQACLTLPAVWRGTTLLAVPYFQAKLVAARNKVTPSECHSGLTQLIDEKQYFSVLLGRLRAPSDGDWHSP